MTRRYFPRTALSLFLSLLLILLLNPGTVLAQEDGFDETFDDPNLRGWEIPRETAVIDGVLTLQPGAFALRAGDWSQFDLSLKLKFSEPGEVAMNYYFRDQGRYGLRFEPGHVLVEKESGGGLVILGETDSAEVQSDTWLDLRVTVQDGDHEIFLNNTSVLTANDPEPLETGAFLFQAFDQAVLEIDDFSLRGTPGGAPPEGQPMEGEQSPVEGEQPMEGEPMPGDENAGAPELFTAETTPQPVTGTSEIQQWISQITGSSNNVLSTTDFMINLLLAVVFSYVLSRVYIHWGASLSNRRRFAANFVLISVTTTFIILVVRSSVALSLGLVGALSIVRFRSAIKEPEELAYLFFAISIGIGLGDNQRLITALAVLVAVVVLAAIHFLRGKTSDFNLHLTVRGPRGSADWQKILSLVDAHCTRVKLLRDDDSSAGMESTFLVEFKSIQDYNTLKDQLRTLSPALEITFLDNKGIW